MSGKAYKKLKRRKPTDTIKVENWSIFIAPKGDDEHKRNLKETHTNLK